MRLTQDCHYSWIVVPIIAYPLEVLCRSLLCTWLLVLAGCSSAPQSQESAWQGTEDRFNSDFQVRDGLFHDKSGEHFNGTIIVQGEGQTLYSIRLREGRLLRFLGQDGKGMLHWHKANFWAGVDRGWELDFEQQSDGLFHRPSGKLFTGKVISLNDNNGNIEVEYNYLNGIPHGPEIYFGDNHEELSRQIWVQGKIPTSKL